MTNSTLPRFDWAAARRLRTSVIFVSGRVQLRSAGLPAMTAQIRTFGLTDAASLVAPAAAARWPVANAIP
jgi:hypothetical protein